MSEEDNSEFLDLMEDYFAQPEELLKRDERPELGYQVRDTHIYTDPSYVLTYFNF